MLSIPYHLHLKFMCWLCYLCWNR